MQYQQFEQPVFVGKLIKRKLKLLKLPFLVNFNDIKKFEHNNQE